MTSTSQVALGLFTAMVLWTLYRLMDKTGGGSGTFDGKCFGLLPWAVTLVTVGVLVAMTHKMKPIR